MPRTVDQIPDGQIHVYVCPDCKNEIWQDGRPWQYLVNENPSSNKRDFVHVSISTGGLTRKKCPRHSGGGKDAI